MHDLAFHKTEKHDGEFENCKTCTERKNAETAKCPECGETLTSTTSIRERLVGHLFTVHNWPIDKAERYAGEIYNDKQRKNATPRCECGGKIQKVGDDSYECDDCGREYESDDWGKGRLKETNASQDRRAKEEKQRKNEKPILIGGESVNVPLECLVTIEASLLERKNAIRPTAPAKRYEFKFIEPGLVKYEDVVNSGHILLQKEAIDKMLPSFVGKPVFNMMHKETDLENFREQADGVITRTWYNAKDGWYYGEALVWDPDTQRTCDKGATDGSFSISCAYNPTEGIDRRGEWHNIPYEGEITNGEGTHIAVVSNPRYEAAQIFRLNSKGGPPMKLFQWLKGSKQEIDPEKSVVKNGDEEVPVTKLLEVFNASKSGSPAAIALDAEVESEGGEKVSVNKLLEVYNAAKKEKENAAEAKKLEEEQERKNSAEHFRQLEAARAAGGAGGVETPITTRDEQVAAGRSMFGSAKK